MTKFKKQIVAALSAGSMLFSTATSAFAATTLEISGNGTDSKSNIVTENSGSTTVLQSNTAVVTNNITSNSNTGDNSASKNTGGDVAVRTGDAKTEVKVENNLNSNTAHVDCCANGDTDVVVSGNGYDSDNKVVVKDARDNSIYQNNEAKVENAVEAKANTGKNDTDKNTGGDVLVSTGDAQTKVDVSTAANSNWAVVGGGHNDEGSVSLKVMGNGTDSDNDIYLKLGGDNTIVQDNWADVKNAIEAKAVTGYNDADKNTGGDVAVLTGDAKTQVMVDNMVNFNWANVDCGCVTDLTAKISGNGYESDNTIKATLGGDTGVFQGGKEGNGNTALLDNYLNSGSQTGKNDADKNTSDYLGDPWVLTGDSSSYTTVENSGNVNTYGAEAPSEWPAFDFNFSLSLDWADLMNWAASR